MFDKFLGCARVITALIRAVMCDVSKLTSLSLASAGAACEFGGAPPRQHDG